jgi:regulator of protease activity HflC (stomatin/prohibitin superfamily)
MKSGWYVYWPLIQDCEAIKIRTQVKDLRAQSVWTLDHTEMTVSGAIRYKVSNARKAILEIFDYDDCIQALALGIIQRYIRGRVADGLDIEELESVITKGLREESQGWGLRIEFVYITDIGRTQNFRVLLNEPILSVES